MALLLAESLSNVLDSTVRQQAAAKMKLSSRVVCCNLIHASLSGLAPPVFPAAPILLTDLLLLAERVATQHASNPQVLLRLRSLVQAACHHFMTSPSRDQSAFFDVCRQHSRHPLFEQILTDCLLQEHDFTAIPALLSQSDHAPDAVSFTARPSPNLAKRLRFSRESSLVDDNQVTNGLSDDPSSSSSSSSSFGDWMTVAETLELGVADSNQELVVQTFQHWVSLQIDPAQFLLSLSAGSRTCKILICLYAGLLHRLSAGPRKIPLSRYGRLAAWEAAAECAELPAETEQVSRQWFSKLAWRLYQEDSERSTNILAVADAFFELGRFDEAVPYYLTHQFVHGALGATAAESDEYLERLVCALQRSGACAEAAALAQYHSPKRLKEIFEMVQADSSLLNEAFFGYFWEESVLELLASVFASLNRPRIVSRFVAALQNPDLKKPSQKTLMVIRDRLFQQLFNQFLWRQRPMV